LVLLPVGCLDQLFEVALRYALEEGYFSNLIT